MQDAMAMGMQMSVVCSEDAASMVARGRRRHLLGNGMTEAMAAMCAVWPRARCPRISTKPLASEVPALVLEGEFDPVTPPRYGEEVVKSLKNGRLLVLRPGPQRDRRRLHAQAVRAVPAGREREGARRQVPRHPRLRATFTSFNGWQP